MLKKWKLQSLLQNISWNQLWKIFLYYRRQTAEEREQERQAATKYFLSMQLGSLGSPNGSSAPLPPAAAAAAAAASGSGDEAGGPPSRSNSEDASSLEVSKTE